MTLRSTLDVMDGGWRNERTDLRASARGFLDRHTSIAEATSYERSGLVDRGRWAKMGELGWLGLGIPDSLGGSGGDLVDAAVVMHEFGRALLCEPVVGAITAIHTLALTTECADVLRDCISGSAIPAFVVGGAGALSPKDLTLEFQNGVLSGTLSCVVGVADADHLVVAATSSEGPVLVRCPGTAAELIKRTQSSMVEARWSEVVFNGVEGVMVAQGWPSIDGALLRAAVLQASWSAGAGDRMLADAVEYASERYQFGRPIGSFQAIQHRLANSSVTVAESSALAYDAAGSLADGRADSARLVAIAFLHATQGFVHISRQCHQVWGGIGYCEESNLHHFSRRARIGTQEWGGIDRHRQVIADSFRSPAASEIPLAEQADAGSGPELIPLPEDLREFRQTIRRYVRRVYDPDARTIHAHGRRDTPGRAEFIRRLGDAGLLGLSWPKEYGGRSLSAVHQAILQEELEYADQPTPSIEVNMIGPTLIRIGSPSLKARYLLPIATGELVLALGYSEPDAGSDLASMRTKAVLDGDAFVINGRKMFTSNADYAHAIWLAARTSDEGRRHEGISIILVDTDLPGVEIRPVLTMGGHNTTEVTFTDVRVPSDRLVGELNRGWSYMMEALDHERMAGLSCGGLRRDLEALAAGVFGYEKSSTQREQLVIDATVEVAAVRTHFERALGRLERGEVPSSEATMLKLRASEVRQWLSDRVIDEFGPESLLKGEEPSSLLHGRFEYLSRAEVVSTIVAGTSEIQRNILANRHLGLPRG